MWGRKVSWGVRCGGHEVRFTTTAVPVMTRLRMEERAVLDTLIDAGVARSRSEALAWCVRLVARHEGDWIDELRTALDAVAKARAGGPDCRLNGPGHRRTVAVGQTAPVIVDAARYVDGKREGGRLPIDGIGEAASGPDAFVWIGLHDPSPEELVGGRPGVRHPRTGARGRTLAPTSVPSWRTTATRTWWS